MNLSVKEIFYKQKEKKTSNDNKCDGRQRSRSLVRKTPPLILQSDLVHRSLSSSCRREAKGQEIRFDLAKEKRRLADERRMAKMAPEKKAKPPMPTPPMPINGGEMRQNTRRWLRRVAQQTKKGPHF